jgi:hypothetical protein
VNLYRPTIWLTQKVNVDFATTNRDSAVPSSSVNFGWPPAFTSGIWSSDTGVDAAHPAGNRFLAALGRVLDGAVDGNSVIWEARLSRGKPGAGSERATPEGWLSPVFVHLGRENENRVVWLIALATFGVAVPSSAIGSHHVKTRETYHVEGRPPSRCGTFSSM